ncbi:ATP-grasp domain-containing protein [Paenibacillus sp. GbtcB18]|uniref:ATP-grasp domain-containing protein n=1 Tax=Paenibacillus sp. GbtcB18 TaxID=2824763 RepID=UPI001C2F6057|nr:ATP-grasp domain-containing protein [Paenibacillus sp. GbtcB18]
MSTRKKPGSRRILITGGRAPAALDLARQLSALGHTIYAADSLASPLLRFSRCIEKFTRIPGPRDNPSAFAEALQAIVREQSIDLLIPTCEETFYVAQIKSKLQGCTVLTDDFGKLIALHDKASFIRLVEEAALPAPHTVLLETEGDMHAFLEREGTRKWVLKPVFSRFANHTRLYGPGEVLPRINVSPDNPWVVQHFVEGQEYCVYAVAHEGRLTAYADYAADFTAGRGATIYFKSCGRRDLFGWVEHFVREIRFTGQIAFDFIVHESGVIYPLECNPRATSGLHLFTPEEGIDRALLDCTDTVIIPAPGGRPAMITAAMLMYGAAACGTSAGLRRWIAGLARGRDVIFSRKDWGPALAQGKILLDLWREARAKRVPLKEITTYDIEWNGYYESVSDGGDGFSRRKSDPPPAGGRL